MDDQPARQADLDLLRCAAEGDLDGVRKALAAGANVDAEVDDECALELAARSGHEATVRALLDAGAADKDRAFGEAAVHGHVALAKLLVDAGADPSWGVEPDYPRCPVCYRRICPGALEVCEHILFSVCDGELTTWHAEVPEAAAEIGGLSDTMDNLQYEDVIDRLDSFPPAVRDAVYRLADGGSSWYQLVPGPIVVKDFVTNAPVSWSVSYWFHERPGDWFVETTQLLAEIDRWLHSDSAGE
jgi:hypothetical protein